MLDEKIKCIEIRPEGGREEDAIRERNGRTYKLAYPCIIIGEACATPGAYGVQLDHGVGQTKRSSRATRSNY